MDTYQGLQISKDEHYQCQLKTLQTATDLPAGDVLVEVLYSTLNYKDALAISGKSPVVRQFPLTPGIDLCGKVLNSDSAEFTVGQLVVLNGWGVGETHSGGLAQMARLSAEHLIPLPEALSPLMAMQIGTAGYTAMLCVQALQHHGIGKESGQVLVTGAAGGVGSIAVYLLAQRGYDVVAASGRPEEADYLKHLGASSIIHRDELNQAGKPLQKERWAAAVDVVGSHTLANVCAGMQYGGVVAACGLAQGMDFPATVAPFILRGVSLLGIDSVYCPREKRLQAWQALAAEVPADVLDSMSQTIGLYEAIEYADKLLTGQVRGRLVVDVKQTA